MGADRSAKFLRRSRAQSHARSPKVRQQVAAVCYRIGSRGVEFLLVQTRSGRWTFPKGGVEPGLTHAQSAALEAFEEAGVHGRMERAPFARYFRRARVPDGGLDQPNAAVIAHLCEVCRLEPPLEPNRNPRWFSAEKAKQRLRKDRGPSFGTQLAGVVDRAVSRIQRLHTAARHAAEVTHRESLQKVCFEAHEEGRLPDGLRMAVLARYIHRTDDASDQVRRRLLRLTAGTASPTALPENVISVDSGRRTTTSRASAARAER